MCPEYEISVNISTLVLRVLILLFPSAFPLPQPRDRRDDPDDGKEKDNKEYQIEQRGNDAAGYHMVQKVIHSAPPSVRSVQIGFQY